MDLAPIYRLMHQQSRNNQRKPIICIFYRMASARYRSLRRRDLSDQNIQLLSLCSRHD